MKPLVCFDWGGVILRICHSFDEARERAGLDARDFHAGEGPQRRRREVSLAYETGWIGCDEFFRSISEASGGAYSPEEFRAIHDAVLIEEYPGIPELIVELHGAGVETALLSNTNHRHWLRRAESDCGPAFPTAATLTHPHASHLLRCAKPDAAIFRGFEDASGRSPSEIIFFDDREENVRAARSAGWVAERIDPAADTCAQIRSILRECGLHGR